MQSWKIFLDASFSKLMEILKSNYIINTKLQV